MKTAGLMHDGFGAEELSNKNLTWVSIYGSLFTIIQLYNHICF